jgi:hypothetical protein
MAVSFREGMSSHRAEAIKGFVGFAVAKRGDEPGRQHPVKWFQ